MVVSVVFGERAGMVRASDGSNLPFIFSDDRKYTFSVGQREPGIMERAFYWLRSSLSFYLTGYFFETTRVYDGRMYDTESDRLVLRRGLTRDYVVGFRYAEGEYVGEEIATRFDAPELTDDGWMIRANRIRREMPFDRTGEAKEEELPGMKVLVDFEEMRVRKRKI